MILKSQKFDHLSKEINRAINVSDDTMLLCRERIFFAHFSNSLQAIELFENIEDAPKQLTTVTGDLEKTLTMVSEELEYEYTLLYFLNYHEMAQKAFSFYQIEHDGETSHETKMKLEILKLLSSFKAEQAQEEEKTKNKTILDHGSMIKRINAVKKANHNFYKYLDLMSFKIKTHDQVDDIIRDIFSDDKE